jgi:hypothetical protein
VASSPASRLIAPLIRLIAPLIRLIAPLIRWDAGSPASGVQHSARHGASQPKVVHEDDVDEEVVELEVELPSEVRADCKLIAC